jgi:hypothetical protein
MGGGIGRDSEDGGSTGALGGSSDPSSPELGLPDDDDDDEAGGEYLSKQSLYH